MAVAKEQIRQIISENNISSVLKFGSKMGRNPINTGFLPIRLHSVPALFLMRKHKIFINFLVISNVASGVFVFGSYTYCEGRLIQFQTFPINDFPCILAEGDVSYIILQ